MSRQDRKCNYRTRTKSAFATRSGMALLVCLTLAACYRRPAELDQWLAKGSQEQPSSETRTEAEQPKKQARSEPTAQRPTTKKSVGRPKKASKSSATNEPDRSVASKGSTARKKRRRIPRIILRKRRSERPAIASTSGAERPAAEAENPAGAEQSQPGSDDGEPAQGGDEPATEAAPADWKSYIAVDELNQEIKFLLEQIELKIRTRKDFDRYFREVEGDAAVLGILAVVLQEHPDSDRKTRRMARTLAELSMDLALAASERSAENYDEAKTVYEDAVALVAGQRPGESGDPVTWEDVASLGDLMARIDTGFKRIRGGVNTPTFDKDNYLFAHEARLLAILSRVSSFYRSNEPTYVKYAREMEQWALRAAEASEKKDRDLARKAVSQLNRVCNQCHRAFRLERGTGNSLDF